MLIYDPTSPISKHFKMYEIAKSDIAIRDYIDNTPSPVILDNALLLAENVLEPIREHFGIPFSPTSWFRCEQLEWRINEKAFKIWAIRTGKQASQDHVWKEYFALKSHPKGEAADIEIPGISNDVLYDWIKENIPEYDQLIREFGVPGDPTSGWVHVSYRLNNNRKQNLVITG